MKTIKKYDLKGKKVIIRCDFNVPIEKGVITNDYRITQSLKTIKYAINEGAKVILLSHLGRIKTKADLAKYNLKPVSTRLSELLGIEVKFSEETRGRHVKALVRNLKEGEVLLLQNTRYEDLEGNKESNCDDDLSKYWASLGDIFINDAFGAAHRNHASTVGIAKYLPNGIGLLMDKELKMLSKIFKNPEAPYVVVLGGAKVDSKIEMIEKLIKKADYILVCGAMANTFLKAAGFKVGASKVEYEHLDYCINLLEENADKIILPIDVITDCKERFVNEIGEDEIIYDIGPSTIKVFKQYLNDAKTIFYNGPAGMYEDEKYASGTKALAEAISATSATTIVGGGDTASAVINMGYADKFTHISTGGGASLEYLEGKTLPALKVINK